MLFFRVKKLHIHPIGNDAVLRGEIAAYRLTGHLRNGDSPVNFPEKPHQVRAEKLITQGFLVGRMEGEEVHRLGMPEGYHRENRGQTAVDVNDLIAPPFQNPLDPPGNPGRDGDAGEGFVGRDDHPLAHPDHIRRVLKRDPGHLMLAS